MKFGRNKVLDKIIEEELKRTDLANRIERIQGKRCDDAINKGPQNLPIKEIWGKENEQTNLITEIGIATYPENIPNQIIKIPQNKFTDTYYINDHEQTQLILAEEGIFLRRLNRHIGENNEDRSYATYDISLATLNTNEKEIISQYQERIIHLAVKDFLEQPQEFLRHTAKNIISTLILLPETHLSLNNWWEKHGGKYRESRRPNKSDWEETTLLYASILRPELEKQRYELKNL